MDYYIHLLKPYHGLVAKHQSRILVFCRRPECWRWALSMLTSWLSSVQARYIILTWFPTLL